MSKNSNVPRGQNGIAGKPLSDEVIETALARPMRVQSERGAKGVFLKGPIPVSWLSKASQLGGKCLTVGIVLWLLAGFKRSRKVKVEHKWLREFGVGRNAAYNDLKKLEEADLILVHRRRGRSPVVTIKAEDGMKDR